jgi:hypothetical protein
MATVLQFSSRVSDRKSEALHFGPAQIVIFPGVRFERLRDEDVAENQMAIRTSRIVAGSNQALAEDLE